MEICQHLSKMPQPLSTLDIITIYKTNNWSRINNSTERITRFALVEATKKKPTRQLMRFTWRTETMVLPDHKVGITEQSQGCWAYSKVITKGGTTHPSPKTHIVSRKTTTVKIHEQSRLSQIAVLRSSRFGYHYPAKNANKLSTAWQNSAGNRHIHGQKENRLKLFRSGGKLPAKLNNPKPLCSRIEELYYSKEVNWRKCSCIRG